MPTKPQPGELSDIIIGMAKRLLRSPESASEHAVNAALVCAAMAWNKAIGAEFEPDEYKALLKSIEVYDPSVYSELTSTNAESMVAELIRYKQAHHPDDRRHILDEALRSLADRQGEPRLAAPFVDPRSESRVRDLVLQGECNAAVEYLKEDEGLSEGEAVQRVAEIALRVVKAWGGAASRPTKVRGSAKKRQAGHKPQTKSDFLRKTLGRNPGLDLRKINERWTKAGQSGSISEALFYHVRSELGIKTTWAWVKTQDPPARRKPVRPTGEINQFKITLKDTQPPIWRRIQVGDCTLDTLHEHIQTAMGWTNSHLHQFRIDGTLFGDPDLMEEQFEELDYTDSTTTRISEIVPRNGKRYAFEYEYDLGDSWIHEVLFEGRPPAERGKTYPLCLEGAGACPPEDVGGTSGYADFLEALADPAHEEHETMLEWVGGKFDPEAFHAAAATKRMKKGLPDWREEF
jgi:hypothetical protein